MYPVLRITAAALCLAGSTVVAQLPTGKPASTGQRATQQIEIDRFAFQRQSLSADQGDIILWINRDIVPHTVTDGGGAFDSGSLAPGASWKLVAKTAGTYHYICTLHPNMVGTLIVRPAKE